MLEPEDLTPEQRAEWQARHRSWEAGQRALGDPAIRARLDEVLRNLDEEPQPPAMSPAEFFERASLLSPWPDVTA